MKKLFGIAMALALIASLAVGSVALAADPTEVIVNWDGGGSVGGSVTAGDDASANFYSGSNYQVGEFHAVDNNNNPYGYGVDSCTFSLDTSLNGGGMASLLVDRTDAKTSYGGAGQQSYTSVFTYDGCATLQNRSSTNYASMKDCNYGWNANDHITVSGSSYYELQRYVDSGAGNYAEINATGGGDADLDCMGSEASAGQVRLGFGCGCYTNANFTANGAGTMELYAQGNNSTTTAMAPGMTGATSFDFVASWVGTFNIPDYSTTAN